MGGLSAGRCTGLDDGFPCTVDTCDEATDTVKHTPSDALCNNAYYCDGTEQCIVGAGCVSVNTPVLSDGVACTVDTCDEANKQVNHIPDDSQCSDDNHCTTDTCDPALGCASKFNGLSCDDGDPCTQFDVCTAGQCVSGPDNPACICTTDADCAPLQPTDQCLGVLTCQDNGTTGKTCKIDPTTVVVCDPNADTAV